MNRNVSRRELLRTAAVLGLAPPLLAACGDQAPTSETAKHEASASACTLGRDYLALGLLALAKAQERGWARGHHGAAVIASYFFCLEHGLDERTVHALRKQVDAFVAHRKAEFPVLDPGPGEADPGPILEQLNAHIHELRSGGHDAIYASLALRALDELPHYATPKIVDGIRLLLVSFVETLPVVAETDWQREHPVPGYQSTEDLVHATREALLRPWDHVLAVGAGQVVHWVTHADALVTLEELGHADLARRGYAAHQRYLHQGVESGTSPGPEIAPIDWLSPPYWESEAPRTPQKGTWFFGHSFKLPYSLLRLLRGVDDEEIRSACLHRASQLYVPFL
jgi:hypothetical protein